MPFMQFSLQVDAQQCPALESVLEELGALAITYADTGGEPVLEPGVGESPLWARVRLIALFDEDMSGESVERALSEALGDAPSEWRAERVEDRAWERAWMDDFRPMRFGDRLWVVPTNMEPPEPDAVNLRLDPGLAFGTGTHPTTSLCLRMLDRADLAAAEVVDFGCGSGILGVAALLLGARRCLAIDNDPQALVATRENAERNGVAERLSVCAPEQAKAEPVDGVIANILAGVLIELAPGLQAHVRSGGWVALSGILVEQAEAVAQAYAPWFDLNAPEELDGWVLLTGRKR